MTSGPSTAVLVSYLVSAVVIAVRLGWVFTAWGFGAVAGSIVLSLAALVAGLHLVRAFI